MARHLPLTVVSASLAFAAAAACSNDRISGVPDMVGQQSTLSADSKEQTAGAKDEDGTITQDSVTLSKQKATTVQTPAAPPPVTNKFTVKYTACPNHADATGYDQTTSNVESAKTAALAALQEDCGPDGQADLTFFLSDGTTSLYKIDDGKVVLAGAPPPAAPGTPPPVETPPNKAALPDLSQPISAAVLALALPTDADLLKNYATDKCVEIGGGVRTRGQGADQWTCIGGQLDYQHWNLEKTTDGYWIIKRHDLAFGNNGTPQCLEIGGGNPANGATANQYDCVAGEPNQMWHIDARAEVAGGAVYTIKNKRTGKCLEVPGADKTANVSQFQNGMVLSQYDCLGVPNQAWTIVNYQTGAP